MKPIDHPGAWDAAELIGRKDWSVSLGESAQTEVEQALGSTKNRPIEDLEASDFGFEKLAKTLRDLQTSLEEGCGATLLRGLKIDQLSKEECRRLFWGISLHLGTPVSQSAKGEKIFSVRDEGFAEGDSRARGPNTRKKLSFHTDRCDVIGFFCLQQAKSGGENEVVSSMAIYNRILESRPDLLEELFSPYCYLRHNVDLGNEKPYCEQPIFSFQDGVFASAFLRVLIERAYQSEGLPEMTLRQREALDLIEEIAADETLHVRFRQGPGDILFLNNWVTYHRRTEFEDDPDPQKRRHILRIWLSPPNNRQLAPWFEANYGATAAGTVRGGMKASV
ncbi:MAG: TauD/TfdA family dioxygenase [Verrucomicrobiota bacterium]